MILTFPIVGAFYRPPAKALLAVLPVGTPLILCAEPDNPADPNAIAVWLLTASIPDTSLAVLDGELGAFGKTLSDVVDMESHHVGYIPKEVAAKLRYDGFPVQTSVPGTFSCTTSGAPMVRFEL